MKEGECVVGPIHFLCLDCWYAYFQSLDEIASAPFRGRCSNCRHNIGPLIPCKSESPWRCGLHGGKMETMTVA